MITLTNRQARQFMLLKHGLLGEYKFTGKQGVLDFVRQAGCIQYDPIDVCGRNSELVLQSRVKGFGKTMLDELLYTDRKLIDYPDKNLAILPIENWPYFERYRQASRKNGAKYPEMHALTEQVRRFIEQNGAICSDDLKLEGNFFWRSAIHWSGGNNLSRSVMEQMYSTGDLVIHHKKGTRKYYDIAERHIPPELLNAADPLQNELDHLEWRVLRRIGAVGILWNRPSDAWLNIWGLRALERNAVFSKLLEQKKIIEIEIDGIKDKLYALADDQSLLEMVRINPEPKSRCELIAPLDNFMWDRKLVKAIFDFDYTWEIYTPEVKRKYGYYVLPLIYGESFAGRVEAMAERKSKTLVVNNIWYENGIRQTKKLKMALNGCLDRFSKFNNCRAVSIEA